jgi:serine beta-lactamase-like protein LACTB, mitochondrial
MLKGRNRMETWLTLMIGGVGLIILGVAGLWIYVSATAQPIHPSAQGVPSAAQSTPAAAWTGAVEQARQIARAQVAEQNLPGLSIAVGVLRRQGYGRQAGGEIVWAEGFGWADLEKQTKVAPDTRFRIGTLSTPLTSAAAGLLIEQGRLNLDEPIQKHVPEFPEKQWPVTLRQVMAHVAGMPSDGGDEGPLFGQHCDRPVEALQHFAKRELRSEPGTEYRYSRFGWIVVSAAIEAAADEPFLTFMRKQIFEPLGMRNTDVDSGVQAAVADRATSYFPRFAADPRYGPDVMRDLDMSCYAGAGAFVSTPTDLVQFALAINRGKLIQPATVQLLQATQRTASGQQTGYGLGWDVETIDVGGQQARSIGYDGDLLGGIITSLLSLPDHGIVVAVASNTSYADTFEIGSQIAQAFAAHSKTPVR